MLDGNIYLFLKNGMHTLPKHPIDGSLVYVQVKTVHCKPGETVGEGDLLVELE